jgi:hypothetical protein
MEVQEQSEISTMHVEIHQRYRLPLSHLLNDSRQIRRYRARSDTAPGADHADHPPGLIFDPGGSASESLLEPCERRFDIQTGQRLRKKLLDSNSKRLQEQLWIRP